MNIDYAAIIEKANQRKDTLQQLTGLINESGMHAERLDYIIAFMARLNNVYKALDAEGRTLLPKGLREALDYAGGTANFLQSARLNSVSASSNAGLSIIAKHVEAA